MKRYVITIIFLTILSSSYSQDTILDIDGNVYTTINVANQTWLKQNLKVTRFNNGDLIEEVLDTMFWTLTSIPTSEYYEVPYHTYYRGDNELLERYGRLYNWYVNKDERNVCPVGWKVPTSRDFYELISYYDTTALELLTYDDLVTNGDFISTVSGGMFRSVEYWDEGFEGTNETGFSVYPNGSLEYWGGTLSTNKYWGEEFFSSFWTKDTVDYDIDGGYKTRGWSFHFIEDYIRKYPSWRTQGYGIRCIKDTTKPIIIDTTTQGSIDTIRYVPEIEPIIHPNPTPDNVVFTSNDTYIGFEYTIFSVNGDVVRKGIIESISQTINLTNLSNGMYIFRLKDKTFKIIKN